MRPPKCLRSKLTLLHILTVVLILLDLQLVLGKRLDWKEVDWHRALDLEQALANSAAIAYEDAVFVIGGGLTPAAADLDMRPVAEVYYARTRSDGSLSPWEEAPDLPQPLAYHSVVATDKRIYLIGGFNGSTISPYTYFAPFEHTENLTVTLGNWVTSTVQLRSGHGLSTHSAVIHNNIIYLIGGYSQRAPSSLVYSTTITSSGEITNWQIVNTDNPLPPIYRHSSIVYGDNIYVIGGRNLHDLSEKTVYVARIRSDGTLEGWTRLPVELQLPRSLYFSSVVVSEGEHKIFVIGGYHRDTDTRMELDTIFSTRVLTDGGITPWEIEDLSLPHSLFRHSAVSPKNGGVYVIGGKKNGTHLNSVYYIPPLTLTKSNDPSSTVHEGDVITYTISYANTSLITQTNVVITDIIPYNTELVDGSISPGGFEESGVIRWKFDALAVGWTDSVSFQVRIPLLPSLQSEAICSPSCPPPPSTYVLPWSAVCDTTHFWAVGVTHQPPTLEQHTIHVQIPPGAQPTEMWLLMKGTGNLSPTVEGQPAQLPVTSTIDFGASVWTRSVTADMYEDDRKVTIVTDNPRELNALFLFDDEDPPFDETTLYPLNEDKKTFTYMLEIPTVETQTLDVIMPFMDITYLTDSEPPAHDGRLTTVAVKFDDQTTQTIVANEPNLGNGLLMTRFPFTIGPLPDDAITATKVLTVTVDTEDDIYTLGPRICRPVRIENTAWLCSLEAGCISDTVVNAPPLPMTSGIYLPLILKAYP